MPNERHILVNGLSIGTGGGYTVGREVFRYIAQHRPSWKATMAIIDGDRLQSGLAEESLPENCEFLRAPSAAAGRVARRRYENGDLARWADENGVDAVFQLNGMIIPTMRPPTLAHYQDPWPYRTEAWGGLRDRILAMLKRRANVQALKRAACVGFTSNYLRKLITGHHGIEPKRACVFYNGIPDEWFERAAAGVPDWSSRPMEMVTVSNVFPYKRQDLVIRAMPELVKRDGLAELKYRILGAVQPDYEAELKRLARELGVEDRVVIEGRVSDDRVKEAFSTSRCFVLMSVCESFGIPAIEAMSYGAPVVTADCCAMPEVCGDAADLCPMDDLRELTERLARTLTDESRAEELRKAGVEQMQRYRWSDTVGQMVDELERMTA